ncbi:hypothetical protein BESB_084340 [Besnoitia besnoiti]|uniref:Uncharacterized protein n=1 Tax=Besnoitia besnoiti TaxID=94643 RepID=A0A2A9M5J9_BESBE|nr:hypothetical protein BESB_084340 [Besnoitia besnoiti]PFH33235.1 hypothetical protein BESB_084340 [Besnoitia besnoiti]
MMEDLFPSPCFLPPTPSSSSSQSAFPSASPSPILRSKEERASAAAGSHAAASGARVQYLSPSAASLLSGCSPPRTLLESVSSAPPSTQAVQLAGESNDAASTCAAPADGREKSFPHGFRDQGSGLPTREGLASEVVSDNPIAGSCSRGSDPGERHAPPGDGAHGVTQAQTGTGDVERGVEGVENSRVTGRTSPPRAETESGGGRTKLGSRQSGARPEKAPVGEPDEQQEQGSLAAKGLEEADLPPRASSLSEEPHGSAENEQRGNAFHTERRRALSAGRIAGGKDRSTPPFLLSSDASLRIREARSFFMNACRPSGVRRSSGAAIACSRNCGGAASSAAGPTGLKTSSGRSRSAGDCTRKAAQVEGMSAADADAPAAGNVRGIPPVSPVENLDGGTRHPLRAPVATSDQLTASELQKDPSLPSPERSRRPHGDNVRGGERGGGHERVSESGKSSTGRRHTAASKAGASSYGSRASSGLVAAQGPQAVSAPSLSSQSVCDAAPSASAELAVVSSSLHSLSTSFMGDLRQLRGVCYAAAEEGQLRSMMSISRRSTSKYRRRSRRASAASLPPSSQKCLRASVSSPRRPPSFLPRPQNRLSCPDSGLCEAPSESACRGSLAAENGLSGDRVEPSAGAGGRDGARAWGARAVPEEGEELSGMPDAAEAPGKRQAVSVTEGRGDGRTAKAQKEGEEEGMRGKGSRTGERRQRSISEDLQARQAVSSPASAVPEAKAAAGRAAGPPGTSGRSVESAETPSAAELRDRYVELLGDPGREGGKEESWAPMKRCQSPWRGETVNASSLASQSAISSTFAGAVPPQKAQRSPVETDAKESSRSMDEERKSQTQERSELAPEATSPAMEARPVAAATSGLFQTRAVEPAKHLQDAANRVGDSQAPAWRQGPGLASGEVSEGKGVTRDTCAARHGPSSQSGLDHASPQISVHILDEEEQSASRPVSPPSSVSSTVFPSRRVSAGRLFTGPCRTSSGEVRSGEEDSTVEEGKTAELAQEQNSEAGAASPLENGSHDGGGVCVSSAARTHPASCVGSSSSSSPVAATGRQPESASAPGILAFHRGRLAAGRSFVAQPVGTTSEPLEAARDGEATDDKEDDGDVSDAPTTCDVSSVPPMVEGAHRSTHGSSSLTSRQPSRDRSAPEGEATMRARAPTSPLNGDARARRGLPPSTHGKATEAMQPTQPSSFSSGSCSSSPRESARRDSGERKRARDAGFVADLRAELQVPKSSGGHPSAAGEPGWVLRGDVDQLEDGVDAERAESSDFRLSRGPALQSRVEKDGRRSQRERRESDGDSAKRTQEESQSGTISVLAASPPSSPANASCRGATDARNQARGDASLRGTQEKLPFPVGQAAPAFLPFGLGGAASSVAPSGASSSSPLFCLSATVAAPHTTGERRVAPLVASDPSGGGELGASAGAGGKVQEGLGADSSLPSPAPSRCSFLASSRSSSGTGALHPARATPPSLLQVPPPLVSPSQSAALPHRAGWTRDRRRPSSPRASWHSSPLSLPGLSERAAALGEGGDGRQRGRAGHGQPAEHPSTSATADAGAAHKRVEKRRLSTGDEQQGTTQAKPPSPVGSSPISGRQWLPCTSPCSSSSPSPVGRRESFFIAVPVPVGRCREKGDRSRRDSQTKAGEGQPSASRRSEENDSARRAGALGELANSSKRLRGKEASSVVGKREEKTGTATTGSTASSPLTSSLRSPASSLLPSALSSGPAVHHAPVEGGRRQHRGADNCRRLSVEAAELRAGAAGGHSDGGGAAQVSETRVSAVRSQCVPDRGGEERSETGCRRLEIEEESSSVSGQHRASTRAARTLPPRVPGDAGSSLPSPPSPSQAATVSPSASPLTRPSRKQPKSVSSLPMFTRGQAWLQGVLGECVGSLSLAKKVESVLATWKTKLADFAAVATARVVESLLDEETKADLAMALPPAFCELPNLASAQLGAKVIFCSGSRPSARLSAMRLLSQYPLTLDDERRYLRKEESHTAISEWNEGDASKDVCIIVRLASPAIVHGIELVLDQSGAGAVRTGEEKREGTLLDDAKMSLDVASLFGGADESCLLDGEAPSVWKSAVSLEPLLPNEERLVFALRTDGLPLTHLRVSLHLAARRQDRDVCAEAEGLAREVEGDTIFAGVRRIRVYGEVWGDSDDALERVEEGRVEVVSDVLKGAAIVAWDDASIPVGPPPKRRRKEEPEERAAGERRQEVLLSAFGVGEQAEEAETPKENQSTWRCVEMAVVRLSTRASLERVEVVYRAAGDEERGAASGETGGRASLQRIQAPPEAFHTEESKENNQHLPSITVELWDAEDSSLVSPAGEQY